MKKLFLMSLLLISWLIITTSCEKNFSPPETQACNVKDPVNDLEWLKKLIDNIKNDNCVGEVSQYDYENTIVFFVNSGPAICSEPDFSIYNCSGNILCQTTNALTEQNNCPTSLFEKLTNKKVIYKK
jgi:hypothetical protein